MQWPQLVKLSSRGQLGSVASAGRALAAGSVCAGLSCRRPVVCRGSSAPHFLTPSSPPSSLRRRGAVTGRLRGAPRRGSSSGTDGRTRGDLRGSPTAPGAQRPEGAHAAPGRPSPPLGRCNAPPAAGLYHAARCVGRDPGGARRSCLRGSVPPARALPCPPSSPPALRVAVERAEPGTGRGAGGRLWKMEAGEAGPGGRAGSSADSLAEEEEEDEDEEGAGSGRSSRTSSLVSGLLTELYSAAEAAAPSGSARSRVLRELEQRPSQVKYLRLKDVDELTTIKRELTYRISVQSAKLLRLLKQKDRLVHKVQKNCDIVTACLQAVSQKRS
ncbi:PREDICTED: translation initiation factor IF-2-like [Calidris pugnax]|uniref:translation initiation factor IF-2-like n=1 Tax=Calidris pugnax TaxID=198806 RepID=UPI00071E4948|nr:PREDICTED: translation initiation factor IF-2-like [Calidris pugnax]